MINLETEFLDLMHKHKDEITSYLHSVTYVCADRSVEPITWKWSDRYGFVRDPDYKIESRGATSAEEMIEHMRQTDHDFHFEWVDSGNGSVTVGFYDIQDDYKPTFDAELSASNGDTLSPMQLAIYSIFAIEHAKALMQEIFSDTGCDFTGECPQNP